MARDYKHRAHSRDTNNRRRKAQESTGVGVFKWMLVTALIIGFVVFLVYLKSPGLQKSAPLAQIQETTVAAKSGKTEASNKPNIDPKAKEQKPQPPQFDFYTILPKKEMIVPDHEIKTRTREEQVGKNKKASYVIQAGSSRDPKDADQLRAKLALMGIESKIQKAKVESAIWYRVKIGPYSQMGSVNTIMSRLQKNGMKPVITEVDE
ncbi:sporulation domain-containing protein [Methyloglobulus morosus KoM1]|uniref:Sporulation domain-containing protein n=1 Tax=Methyloglobulus morosus KoM1 TaxID=1116472 RepID=V5BFC0_9GAMM|nr:SPOR domain-containing protein [Methyloglobulus morosus]ESS71995.1 sporulation domain-containing protein [Methyloglobulus morosus KoM1]